MIFKIVMYLDPRYRADRDVLRLPSRSLDRQMLVDEHIYLQERFLQFDGLLGYLRSNGVTGDVKAAAARRFKLIKEYEINFIAANLKKVIADPVLLNALIMGGDTLTADSGVQGQIYPVQRAIGIGGMGAVYEAYFSEGATLDAAVVKQFIPSLPSLHTAEAIAAHVHDESDKRQIHQLEVYNIKRFFLAPRPGFVKPLFIGRFKPNEGEVIVYERIVSSNGQSYDLAEISAKWLLPPSALLSALADAVYHLEALHQEDIVHGDPTLLNIFLNENGQGVVGDFCTLFSLKDPVSFGKNLSDGAGYLLSHGDLGSGMTEFEIPNNRSFFDTDLIERSLQSGNSFKVVDYCALAMNIFQILVDFQLLVRTDNGWDYAPWLQSRVALGYPLPSALVDLVALASQLRAIDRPNLSVSLVAVSRILQNIAPGFQESIDPFYRR